MKVSVAMCSYNGEKFIKEQLLSILNQTRTVDEIIICDDQSKDSTVKICEDVLKNQNITYRIIINDVSLKVLRNFEKSFSLCSGDIIFSCDQDDVWEPNKVETFLEKFEMYQHIEMIASNATLISKDNEIMNLSLKESIEFSMNNEDEVMDSLLRTFCITGATMAFRKSFQKKAFYASKYWLHDGWLALIAAMNNSFLYLDEKLTKYRLHGNNECGVGDVDLLHYGTLVDLKNRKEKRVVKTALKAPFYFDDFAREKKNMYHEVKEYIINNNLSYEKRNMKKLNQCISFWEKRGNIREINFKEVQEYIRENKRKGLYSLYCESEKFKYFDLYFWLVYHLIPRKNRG